MTQLFKGIPSEPNDRLVFNENAQLLNATVSVVDLAPDSAIANVDLSVHPKGTGALQMAVADGTINGGNKRGAKAIDLQMVRTAAANVASGAGAIAIGSDNIVAAVNAAAIGSANAASGVSSLATGLSASTGGIIGKHAHSSGKISVQGDSQMGFVGLRMSTPGATPTKLTADMLAESAANELNIPDNSCVYFSGQVVAKQSASTNMAVWTVSGILVRGVGAATTTLVAGTVTAVSNVPVWTAPALAADTTLGGLDITVTGVAATSIGWNCYLETIELVFA